MTATAITLPVEPKRDRYGRYVIPHPDTGKEMSWTRVTTLADTLDDRYNLERWKVRTAALGLVARPDLFALVAAQHDNRDEFNKIMDKAIEAGKGNTGANMGTALHKACERIDFGDITFTMPGAGAADLDAYRKLRSSTGAVPHQLPDGRPGIEVIVIVPELKVAGTFDRLLDLPGELLPCIDDIKTGESAVEWAMTSIAIQLACYAHGTHIFDPATGQLTPMPRVNQSKAFVTHLPAGKAQAAMWEVDIAAGWEAAQHAMWVREWRTKKDKLARHAQAVSVAAPPLLPDDPFAGLPSAAPAPVLNSPPTSVAVADPRRVRRDNLATRAARLKTITGAAERLVALWPAHNGERMPGLTNVNYIHTDDELDAIEKALIEVEKQHEAPFDPPPAPPVEAKPEPKPAPWSPVINEGPDLEPEDIAALKATVDVLDPAPRAWLASIVKAAGEARFPLNMKQCPSTRRYAIVRAVLFWALHIPDNGPFLLGVSTVTGEHMTSLGDVGRLTIEQAARLADLALALEAGDIKAVIATENGAEPALVLVGDLSPYKPRSNN